MVKSFGWAKVSANEAEISEISDFEFFLRFLSILATKLSLRNLRPCAAAQCLNQMACRDGDSFSEPTRRVILLSAGAKSAEQS